LQAMRLLEDERALATFQAHVRRADMIGQRDDGLTNLERIGGLEHQHVGQRSHQRDVVDRLVTRTAWARKSGHETDQAYVQARIGYGHGDLIEAASCTEHSE